jgi:hypothetical protein
LEKGMAIIRQPLPSASLLELTIYNNSGKVEKCLFRAGAGGKLARHECHADRAQRSSFLQQQEK